MLTRAKNVERKHLQHVQRFMQQPTYSSRQRLHMQRRHITKLMVATSTRVSRNVKKQERDSSCVVFVVCYLLVLFYCASLCFDWMTQPIRAQAEPNEQTQ